MPERSAFESVGDRAEDRSELLEMGRPDQSFKLGERSCLERDFPQTASLQVSG